MAHNYNYSKLLGRIKEKGYTQNEIARIAGMTPGTFSFKINNKAGFTQREMDAIAMALDISNDEIGVYFFAV